jgi:hypothetical protein
MLQQLTEMSTDHFEVDPEDVYWGRVGTPGHLARLPLQISDSVFQDGEHAA